MSDRENPVSRLDQRNVAATRAHQGINVNEHPEFDRPSTIENVVSAAKSFWAKIHGNAKPATPMNVPVHSDIPAQTEAQKEAIARKYVD